MNEYIKVECYQITSNTKPDVNPNLQALKTRDNNGTAFH